MNSLILSLALLGQTQFPPPGFYDHEPLDTPELTTEQIVNGGCHRWKTCKGGKCPNPNAPALPADKNAVLPVGFPPPGGLPPGDGNLAFANPAFINPADMNEEQRKEYVRRLRIARAQAEKAARDARIRWKKASGYYDARRVNWNAVYLQRQAWYNYQRNVQRVYGNNYGYYYDD